jgi:hypothetical protein
MRTQITQKQLNAAKTLLRELDEFVNRGHGTITMLAILKNEMLPNTIIVKYNKLYVMGGEFDYQYPIAAIKQSGDIEFLQNNFKDVFTRSSFLAECLPLDLDNPNDFQIID